MLTEYVIKVSQMPVLDYWIRKNLISTRLGTTTNRFALRASQLLNERLAEKEVEHANRRDFVSHLQEYQRNHPGQLSNTAFFGHVMTNLLVGSDSTSVAIRAVIYYVLKTPNVLSTLQAELDAAQLSYPVPWHASQDGLPYLDAVIKEALRFHPPGTLLLERIVPDSGLELSNGVTLPPGTVVGMNGWNIQRLPEVFGSDAAVFNPGRWLQRHDEDTAVFQKRIQRMKRADFTFGHGPRGCVGKPIAMMVMYKLVPTLFGLFDVCDLLHTNEVKLINALSRYSLLIRRKNGGLKVASLQSSMIWMSHLAGEMALIGTAGCKTHASRMWATQLWIGSIIPRWVRKARARSLPKTLEGREFGAYRILSV